MRGLQENPSDPPFFRRKFVHPVREPQYFNPAARLIENVGKGLAAHRGGVIGRERADLFRRQRHFPDQMPQQIRQHASMLFKFALLRPRILTVELVIGGPEIALHQRPRDRSPRSVLVQRIPQRLGEFGVLRFGQNRLRSTHDKEIRVQRVDGAVANLQPLEAASAYPQV